MENLLYNQSSTAVGDPRSPAIGGYASDDSTNYGLKELFLTSA